MKIKYKIIDSSFAHCNYSNNPLPPLQECLWVEWDRTKINDINELIFVTENNILNPNIFTLPNKKIAWLLECREYSPTPYEWILNNHLKYNYVFTHDKELITRISNGIWIPFGGCWVHKNEWSLGYEKNKLVSMMISEKIKLEGHRLRHKIKDNLTNIEIFGRGHKPIEHKIEALKNYKFQVVIENAKVNGYFTEKLIDCFVTGTIPIYWGDPSIQEVFDTSGMIIVQSYDEIVKTINELENIDLDNFNDGKSKNFETSKNYILSEDYFYKNYKHIL
jgi:hypothetical protein